MIVAIALATWLAGAAIASGVMRELDGGWPDGEEMAMTLLWHVVVPVAAVGGLLWCLAWIGRAPVKLLKGRPARAELPAARVVGRKP